MTWWWFFTLMGAVTGVVVGVTSARLSRRRALAQEILITADIRMLEQACRLDEALHSCESDSAWLKHDHKRAPHVGFWIYVDDNGDIQITSRYDTREGWGTGPTTGRALLDLRDRLAEAVERKKALLQEASK